ISFAIIVIFLTASFGTGINVYAMTTHRRIAGPRPTLDGTLYLRHNYPDEYALVEWIRSRIRGTPTILEAQIWEARYQDYARIVKHTGLPSYLGWEFHVYQRGTPYEVSRKRSEI